MRSLIDNDDEFTRGGDRELTLSTGAILGIFLGLVLLCGLFFAFGYKMGSHKSTPLTGTEAANAAATAPTTDFNAFKPAPGSPAGSSTARTTVSVPATAPPTGSGASTPPVVSTRSALTAEPSAPAHTAIPTPVHLGTSSAASPAPIANGNFIVQIAAVSLQEDADLLVGALRSKGYTVSEHPESDKLIHIQAGPFATLKDANTMRQRLLSDGYNAIVK